MYPEGKQLEKDIVKSNAKHDDAGWLITSISDEKSFDCNGEEQGLVNRGGASRR